MSESGDAAPTLLCAYTSVASEAQAQALAEMAVQARLAACVETWPLRSVYRWQGRLQHESETQLCFKTTPAALPALKAAVFAQHPYDTPAWHVLPALEADAHYAAWVRDEIGG